MANNEFSIDYLFPSIVLQKHFGTVDKKIIDVSRDILKMCDERPFYGKCTSTVGVSGYNQILDHPAFEEIRNQVTVLVNVLLDVLKISVDEIKIIDSWLNHYNPGEYQDLHMHHGSIISGVYWIESAGEKDFIVQSPWHIQQPIIPNYKEKNLVNAHNVEYNSVPGTGTVFMSHTLHQTCPSSKERISLSFNVGK